MDTNEARHSTPLSKSLSASPIMSDLDNPTQLGLESYANQSETNEPVSGHNLINHTAQALSSNFLVTSRPFTEDSPTIPYSHISNKPISSRRMSTDLQNHYNNNNNANEVTNATFRRTRSHNEVFLMQSNPFKDISPFTYKNSPTEISSPNSRGVSSALNQQQQQQQRAFRSKSSDNKDTSSCVQSESVNLQNPSQSQHLPTPPQNESSAASTNPARKPKLHLNLNQIDCNTPFETPHITQQGAGGSSTGTIQEQLERLYIYNSSSQNNYNNNKTNLANKLRPLSAQINFNTPSLMPLQNQLSSSAKSSDNLQQFQLELSRIDHLQGEFKQHCDQFIYHSENSLNNFEYEFQYLREAFLNQKKHYETALLEKDGEISQLKGRLNQANEQLLKQQYYYAQQNHKVYHSGSLKEITSPVLSGGINPAFTLENISKRLGFDEDSSHSNTAESKIQQQFQSIQQDQQHHLRESYLRTILGDNGYTQLQEVEGTFDELVRDNKSISDLRTKYSTLLSDLISKIHCFKDSQQILHSQLSDLQEKCNKLQENNSKISVEYQKQMTRLSDLREKCEKYMQQRDQTCLLLTQYERSEINSIQTLQLQYSAKETELIKCQSEVDSLNCQIDQLLLIVGIFDTDKSNDTKNHQTELEQHIMVLDYYDKFLFSLFADHQHRVDPSELIQSSVSQLLADLVLILQNTKLLQRYSTVKQELASILHQKGSLQQANQIPSIMPHFYSSRPHQRRSISNFDNQPDQFTYLSRSYHQQQQQQMSIGSVDTSEDYRRQIDELRSELESQKRHNEKLLNERMRDFSSMKESESRMEILKIKLENKIVELKSRERQFISMMRSLVPDAIQNQRDTMNSRDDSMTPHYDLDYFQIKEAIVKQISNESAAATAATAESATYSNSNTNTNIEKQLAELASSIDEVKEASIKMSNHLLMNSKLVVPQANTANLGANKDSSFSLNSPDCHRSIRPKNFSTISPLLSKRLMSHNRYSQATTLSASSTLASTEQSEYVSRSGYQIQQLPMNLDTNTIQEEEQMQFEDILVSKDEQIEQLLSVLQKSLRVICQLNDRNRIELANTEDTEGFLIVVSEWLVAVKVEEALKLKYEQFDSIHSLIQAQENLQKDRCSFDLEKAYLQDKYQQQATQFAEELALSGFAHQKEVLSLAEQLNASKNQSTLEQKLREISQQELKEVKVSMHEIQSKCDERVQIIQQQLNEEVKSSAAKLLSLKDECQMKIDAIKQQTIIDQEDEQLESYSSASTVIRKNSTVLSSEIVGLGVILYSDISELNRRLYGNHSNNTTVALTITRESPAIELLEKYRELIAEERSKYSELSKEIEIKSACIEQSKLIIGQLEKKVLKLKDKANEVMQKEKQLESGLSALAQLKKAVDCFIADLTGIMHQTSRTHDDTDILLESRQLLPALQKQVNEIISDVSAMFQKQKGLQPQEQSDIIADKHSHQMMAQFTLNYSVEVKQYQQLLASLKEKIAVNISKLDEAIKTNNIETLFPQLQIKPYSNPTSLTTSSIVQVDQANIINSLQHELKASISTIDLLKLQLKQSAEEGASQQITITQLKDQIDVHQSICGNFHRNAELQLIAQDNKLIESVQSTCASSQKELAEILSKEMSAANQLQLTLVEQQFSEIKSAVEKAVSEHSAEKTSNEQSDHQQTQKMLESVKELQTTITNLQSAIVSSQQQMNTIQIQSLKKMLDAIPVSNPQQAASATDSLANQRDLETIKGKLEIAQTNKADLENQIHILTTSLSEQQEINRALQDQQKKEQQLVTATHNQLREQCSQSQQQVQTQTQQIELLENQLQQKSREITELAQQNSIAASQLQIEVSEQYKKTLAQISDLTIELQSKQTEITALKSQLILLEQSRELTLSENSARIAQISESLEASIAECEQLKKQQVEEANLANKNIARMEKNLQTAERFITSMKKQEQSISKHNFGRIKKLGLLSIDFIDGFLIMYSLLIRSHPNRDIQQKFNAFNYNQIVTAFKSAKNAIISNGEKNVQSLLAQIDLAKKAQIYETFNFDAILESFTTDLLQIKSVYSQLESFHDSLKLFLS